MLFSSHETFLHQCIKQIARLKFAIGVLLICSFFGAIGTIFEQNQEIIFYIKFYYPLLKIIRWKLIFLNELDQIYTSANFNCLLIIVSLTLASCTFITQLPFLRRFRLWTFLKKSYQFSKFSVILSLKKTLLNNVSHTYNIKKKHFFRQRETNYGYSGLVSRFSPLMVHCSLIILLFGLRLRILDSYTVQKIVPRGEIFYLQNLLRSSYFSYISQSISCRLNDFWVKYNRDHNPSQFYSDLSLFDNIGKETKRKIIFVNEPLIYNNITFYQTDWDLLGMKLSIDNYKNIQIPLQNLENNNNHNNKIWSGYLFYNITYNFSFVVNTLEEKFRLYNNGLFFKEVEIGKEIKFNNKISFTFYEFIGNTGLQIKSETGIFIISLSLVFLIVTTYTSFLSYFQLWNVEQNHLVLSSYRINREILYFQEEFRKINYLLRLSKTRDKHRDLYKSKNDLSNILKYSYFYSRATFRGKVIISRSTNKM